MKSARLAAVAAMILGLVAPTAKAAPVIAANCVVDGVKAVGDQCVVEWELTPEDAGGFASSLHTHANYHGFPSGGTAGTVKLEWIDAAEKLVFSLTCTSFAISSDGHPAEFTETPFCSETTPADASAPTPGVQKLVVTAVSFMNPPNQTTGTRMHGRLALSPAGDPI